MSISPKSVKIPTTPSQGDQKQPDEKYKRKTRAELIAFFESGGQQAATQPQQPTQTKKSPAQNPIQAKQPAPPLVPAKLSSPTPSTTLETKQDPLRVGLNQSVDKLVAAMRLAAQEKRRLHLQAIQDAVAELTPHFLCGGVNKKEEVEAMFLKGLAAIDMSDLERFKKSIIPLKTPEFMGDPKLSIKKWLKTFYSHSFSSNNMEQFPVCDTLAVSFCLKVDPTLVILKKIYFKGHPTVRYHTAESYLGGKYELNAQTIKDKRNSPDESTRKWAKMYDLIIAAKQELAAQESTQASNQEEQKLPC